MPSTCGASRHPRPKARHHFTLFDQVTQRVNAGEAERRCHRRWTRGSTQPKSWIEAGQTGRTFGVGSRGMSGIAPRTSYTLVKREEWVRSGEALGVAQSKAPQDDDLLARFSGSEVYGRGGPHPLDRCSSQLMWKRGGVGKTVIVLDADTQASACRWRDRRQVPDLVVIDVQPSRLQFALGAAAEQGVDLVVIDTPPRSESAALEAARVANLVIIPCRAQILDLETVPATQQLLALAGNPPAVAILSAVPPRGARAAQARRAIARFGLPVCPHTLGHRAAWGDANALGLTVTEYPPLGRAAEEMRHVALWLTRALAEPEILKGASANTSSRP